MLEEGGYFDDGVFGYDFSEGYTSLEGAAAKVRPYGESALKRWRRRRSELRRAAPDGARGRRGTAHGRDPRRSSTARAAPPSPTRRTDSWSASAPASATAPSTRDPDHRRMPDAAGARPDAGPPAARPAPSRFLDAIDRGPLVLDAGMGTRLCARGLDLRARRPLPLEPRSSGGRARRPPAGRGGRQPRPLHQHVRRQPGVAGAVRAGRRCGADQPGGASTWHGRRPGRRASSSGTSAPRPPKSPARPASRPPSWSIPGSMPWSSRRSGSSRRSRPWRSSARSWGPPRVPLIVEPLAMARRGRGRRAAAGRGRGRRGRAQLPARHERRGVPGAAPRRGRRVSAPGQAGRGRRAIPRATRPRPPSPPPCPPCSSTTSA